MQSLRALNLENPNYRSSSASGTERYRADSVIAPSGTDNLPARICDDEGIDLMRPTLARLAELTNLQTGWDGEDGRPVSVFTLARAIALFPEIVCEFYRDFKEAVQPYDVAPMGDGDIQLEWHGPGGILELEIHPNEGYAYLLIEGQDENRRFEEGDNLRASQIMNLLSRIYRPHAER